MKIVFAGTPQISASYLSLLLKFKNEVIAVLTQPDKPAGRGRKLSSSPVKQLAERENINIFEPISLSNNPQIEVYLKKINPDLVFVVSYGLIIPKEILSIPRLGCINIHMSLLPRWRGASPIEHSIMSGDLKSGVTFMKMDEGLDTGPILAKYPCVISKYETAGSLQSKMFKLTEKELNGFLNSLERGEVNEIKQDENKSTYAKKINAYDTEILWEKQTALEIERKIRAFYPKLGAFTCLGKKRIKILNSEEINNQHNLNPYEFKINKSRKIEVGCKRMTCLQINEIQLEGKKPLQVKEFINGNKKILDTSKKFSKDR
jgi:methionyl-tRNA formyltransferase